MEPKWLWRLESATPDNGLWYDSRGNYVWGIGVVDGCVTKDMPMGFDPRYRQDGRMWFSSCSNRDDLMHWYSVEDAEELVAMGFVFTRYLATEYHEYDMETVFIKETSLAREVFDIRELFVDG